MSFSGGTYISFGMLVGLGVCVDFCYLYDNSIKYSL